MRTNDFLIEVARNRYHIFPGNPGTTQEESMFLIGDKSAGLKTFKIAQKDGSRFPIIETSKKPSEIVIRIAAAHKDRKPIWIGKRLPRSELEERIRTRRLTPKNSTYLLYTTHQFLNGSRGFPIIVLDQLNTFIDVGNWFLDKVPEDEMGVFVKTGEELLLPLEEGIFWKPKEIYYPSEIRLCKHCGIVSNVSTPRENPWGACHAINLEIRERLLAGKVREGTRAGRPKKDRSNEIKKTSTKKRGRPSKDSASSYGFFGFLHDLEQKKFGEEGED